MNGYVITITHNEDSVRGAKRCIDTARLSGDLEVYEHVATTPEDDPLSLAEKIGIDIEGFKEPYSRLENCVAAFLSHYGLWIECVDLNKPIVIFEHDVIVFDHVPTTCPFNGVMNIGQPSYGKWDRPMHLGVGPLTTKRYFPGAHAYMVNPVGAKKLIEQAKVRARPTDIFLNIDTFPWLQEYYPFVARADDSFTTIQNRRGCIAKHNYSDEYRIV